MGIFLKAWVQANRKGIFIGPLNPFLLRILAYDQKEIKGNFFCPPSFHLSGIRLLKYDDKPRKQKFLFGIRRFVPEMISCVVHNEKNPQATPRLHSSFHWSDKAAKHAIEIAIPNSSGEFDIMSKEEFEK